MHYIQQYILDKLVRAPELRNRDMRPPNVESNLYQYHLLQLRKDGYIEKDDMYYRLSGRGLAYADRHSTALKKTRTQPKLITVLFIVNKENQVLLVPRTRQPFMGMYNLPSGKIHLEETVEAAASREINEKVGQYINSESFEHIGTAHITISQDDYTISDYVALLIGVHADLKTVPDGAFFVDPTSPDRTPIMPSVKELLDAYSTKSSFSEHSIRINNELQVI